MTKETKTSSILFVCLGNICRSPAAEAIFKTLANQRNLEVVVDSAGTSGWHEGEDADRRMRAAATKRGYQITSQSRPIQRSDFSNFDLLIAMDDQNFVDLQSLAQTTEEYEKIVRMKDFFINEDADHIPDPYYGGAEGFNQVIDLLEDASEGLLNHIIQKD